MVTVNNGQNSSTGGSQDTIIFIIIIAILAVTLCVILLALSVYCILGNKVSIHMFRKQVECLHCGNKLTVSMKCT